MGFLRPRALPCFLLLGCMMEPRPVRAEGAYHRTPLDQPGSTNLPPSLTNSPIKKVSEDVYELGLVRLDKAARNISFPASVNMVEGLVEYALVHTTGKVHESVLKTDADPIHIHLARLLLATGERAPSRPEVPGPVELQGPRIAISASWKFGGKEQRVPIENLVSNSLTKAKMAPGPWIYSGSRNVDGTFIAQRDGSIVAIIADPDALVNNPRPGRDDDDIWRANQEVIPPTGTRVEVTIQLGK